MHERNYGNNIRGSRNLEGMIFSIHEDPPGNIWFPGEMVNNDLREKQNQRIMVDKEG